MILYFLLNLCFAADWLSTKGNKIVDSSGNEVWLTGINWFGYATGMGHLDGLHSSSLIEHMNEIADHGFNILRIPFSTEIIWQWSQGNTNWGNTYVNQDYNAEIANSSTLEIWDYTVAQAKKVGLKIFVDIHSAVTSSNGHEYPLWYNGQWTTERCISALKWMANRFKDDDTILGYDIKNEPHGTPGDQDGNAIWDNSTAQNNFKYYVEQAASSIHSVNPNALIFVEGIEVYPKDGTWTSKNGSDYYYTWWGANLRGVKTYPVTLSKPNKVVYSPHEYGPAVYWNQSWLQGSYTYDSIMRDYWMDSWFYIHDQGIAPLLVGEWGGRLEAETMKWMTMVLDLFEKYHLHHTMWCFNPNSSDTGGMVKDDWKTWDEEKYKYIKRVLWQSGGKPVGLSHETKLGANGLSLNDVFK